MLYLIKSYLYGGKSILKIGYTDDIDKRMYQYFTTNPGFEKISTREGNRMLEDMIQIYLTFLGYQVKIGGRLNEWFMNSPKVRDIFHINVGELERKLWKIRDKVINLEKGTGLAIYEYLKEKYPNDYRPFKYKVLGRGKLIKLKYNNLDVQYQEIYQKSKQEKDLNDFLNSFNNTNLFRDKMKLFCEYMDNGGNSLSNIDPKFFNYYNFFGTAGCKACSFQEDVMKSRMIDTNNKSLLSPIIKKTFSLGSRLSRKEIKDKLKNIYKMKGINRTPKATDIEEWFDVRTATVLSDKGKQLRGFELIRIKRHEDKIIEEFIIEFNKSNLFRDKLRIFCEFMDNYDDNEYIKNKLSYKIPDPRFLNYYNFFGTEGCRACSFQEDVILTRLKDTLLMDTIYSELVKEFKIGDKLSKKEIKERLGIVYKNANIKQTPKATDLSRWFEIKDVSIYPGENKKIHGFEILALKKI